MTDFTSSLYLGFRHASWSLEPWEELTGGRPATLEPPRGEQDVARQLAELTGCAGAILAPSTLHAFWDLFGILAGKPVSVYLDAGAYPVARWGVERATGRGAPLRLFPAHDWRKLRRLLAGGGNRRPVVVADGFCPSCGEPAPVKEYLQCVREYDGYLVLDDTQALGVWGESPGPLAPYGAGGGGSLRLSGVSDRRILTVSSLAKGFGAPVAVITGSKKMLSEIVRAGGTRTHCSPPSSAVISAAARALLLNRRSGDALRRRLAGLVSRFRSGLAEAGFDAAGGPFPVQTIQAGDAAQLHKRLAAAGVLTVLHRARTGNGSSLSFILTAVHKPGAIDRAVETLARLRGRSGPTPSFGGRPAYG